MAKQNKLD